MSKPRTASTITASSSSSCASSTDPSRSVSKVLHGKSQDKKDAEVPLANICKELQSPPRRAHCIFSESNHGDSSNDLEPSQDIVWGAMSPPAEVGPNVRTLEIADIVNLIAPKDTKPRGPLSPLWQWLCSPTPLTPDAPRTRIRKKSHRQNNVNELIKLARQFDENMQQDKQASAQLNNNNQIDKTPTETPSPLNQTEAELRALFDSSTQKVSGALSPVSSKSTQGKSQLNKSNPGPEKVKESSSKCGDFDDDWDNDDLLNDSSLLALMQNPDQDCSPVRQSALTNLRDFCPKVKPTPRSTFKLETNPYLQTVQPKPETSTNNISDCEWDDGDDDALFYQACDSVESLSQPARSTPAATPLAIHQTLPPNRKSPRTIMRSSSLPSNTLKVNQGWKAPVYTNLPIGCRVPIKQEPLSPLKRNVCNAAVKSNKVFVTNQMTGKCSAADIERKKQEALARRRQRMQNTQKL
ncbi:uncharacterized protein ACBT44_012635 [Syngnathus typhle]